MLIFNLFSNLKGGRGMSEYTETQTVVQDVPVESGPVVETRYDSVVDERRVIQNAPFGRRPVVETRYDSVVNERRGMSGVAVAALVVAGITAAVVITMLIMNNQQRNSDEILARERARTAVAQQTPPQPSQQPVIVNMPPSQPAIVPTPYLPSEPGSIYAKTAPSSASVEIEITSRLQNDEELRPYAIFVKVTGATAILSGYVPDEDLRKRAEKVVTGVKGVQSIINDIAVRP
jgi:BON domain-containing protein